MTKTGMELWGGVEATVNRVASASFDQIKLTGHHHRASDVDLFASLGFTAMRYPVLWERVAPNGLDLANWSWSDERLSMLRERGIDPIVGLLHHGNGPSYTNLLDPEFPVKFASYARAVAERYPWVSRYTPINEPMTTARFSGLYGHWYPHARNERTFVHLLFAQCRGIILAMRAIREVNPDAQLIQTEDVGHSSSTSTMRYQADFENHRRWLSLDLLSGELVRGTRMRDHLHWLGIADLEVDWFEENPYVPDMIGVDYYVTSDRYLDERCEVYPPHTLGGNGKHDYADIEAVRASPSGICGIRRILHDVWNRYRIPVAVTEAHLASTVDEQIRWVAEVWNEARQACDDGADVRAVTAWALLGAYDWDSLVTVPRGHYEAGAFDVSADGNPVATPLAPFLADLARTGRPNHRCLAQQGWWHQPERLIHQVPVVTSDVARV